MPNKTEDLLNRLEEMPLTKMDKAAFRALMRLQVWLTGRTHELMLAFGDGAQALLLKHADKDGLLDSGTAFAAQTEINTLWGDTWTEWMKTFERTREEAARIAFGVQAQFHDRLVLPVVEEIRPPAPEGASPQMRERAEFGGKVLVEGVTDAVYDPQLRILLQVAGEYLYGDGMTLSGRVWRIDRQARDGISSAILKGVQSGDSAWNIAKSLDGFLGAGQDCPRWTSTRLYGMTATDKTTSTAGLISGKACDGQGVSYQSLRLARTEIQKIHNLANDRMMAQEPWVREEQVHLSAAHPKRDICDDVVEKNGGVYSVGEIELPLHPNCLCYKTAVLVSEKEFTDELNGWANGTQASPTFDAYAQSLGVDLSTSLAPESVNLAVWLLSDELDEWMK